MRLLWPHAARRKSAWGETASVFLVLVDGSFGNAVDVAQRTWDYSMSKGRRELILKLVIRQGPLGELMGSTTLF